MQEKGESTKMRNLKLDDDGSSASLSSRVALRSKILHA
jgi:hypothetical protein